MSPLQEEERRAMTGDGSSVLRIVGALRRYRQAVENLLEATYSDGECDAVALAKFKETIEDIERDDT
jgi:hypothetical protein